MPDLSSGEAEFSAPEPARIRSAQERVIVPRIAVEMTPDNAILC